MAKIIEKIKNFLSKYVWGTKKKKEPKVEPEESKPEEKPEEQK